MGFVWLARVSMIFSRLTSKQQLESFIARYSPEVASVARKAFVWMRKKFPRANVLVYDNYNALAIGFAADRAGIRGGAVGVAAGGGEREDRDQIDFGQTASAPDREGPVGAAFDMIAVERTARDALASGITIAARCVMRDHAEDTHARF